MRIGIDASNIRAGGGVTHLRELLTVADPEVFGIERVSIWGGSKTLDILPERPWLEKIHDPLLDSTLLKQLWWQRYRLDGLARSSCDLLFVPGGNYHGKFRPYVAMSQNMLPFEVAERRRYGFSFTVCRLELLSKMQASTFRMADGVLFLTQTALSSVEKSIGRIRGKVAVIPHGVTESFRHEVCRDQSGLSNERKGFHWLYVSTVDVYKHQWHVADAVPLVKAVGLNLKLDFVGPAYPPALKRLQKVLQRVDPTGKVIVYRGPAAHHDLPALYRKADGFIFASSCEAMGIILLEAMAARLPIACSNRGPMPEVLGDAGVYFDPESPGDIASAMLKMMCDRELREELAERAYNRALEFTWQRCARETFAFLADVGGAVRD
ncbi:MAG: glycosyltransferase family 4 protein [Proteobacteria bacterium]|nr:glycosyltransferase family 4 protein [Pseudomonadota bacterium]